MSVDIMQFYWFVLKCMGLFFTLVALLAIILYKFQNRIIYLPIIEGMPKSPNNNIFGLQNPSQMDLPYEDVFITTEDNLQLHGWMTKQADSLHSPTIVYFHENAGNIGTRIHYLKEYSEQISANMLLVAYRGYSNSEGDPTEKGIMADSRAILRYIFNRSDIDTSRVYLHGRSLGGAVAIYAAAELHQYHISGVIIENTFTSMSDMADVVFKKIRFLKEIVLHNYWPSIDRIKRIKYPILFIQSLEDEIVPPEQMTKLYKAASKASFKQLFMIHGGTHNNGWFIDPYSYFAAVSKFIEKCSSLPGNSDATSSEKITSLNSCSIINTNGKINSNNVLNECQQPHQSIQIDQAPLTSLNQQ